MPCRSDYLEPNQFEVEAGRLDCLLTELKTGEHVNPQSPEWRGGHPMYYNRGPTKSDIDSLTAALCKRLTAMTPEQIQQCSLEMQIWWRNHQRADAKRKAIAQENRRQEAMRKRALAKLTPEEQKALGLKR